MIIAGDLVHAEQALYIIPALRVPHATLESQKRRALREEYRESTERGVLYLIAGIVAPPLVRQLTQSLTKMLDQVAEFDGLQARLEGNTDVLNP